jgi:hypothetical protein
MESWDISVRAAPATTRERGDFYAVEKTIGA